MLGWRTGSTLKSFQLKGETARCSTMYTHIWYELTYGSFAQLTDPYETSEGESGVLFREDKASRAGSPMPSR